MVRRAIAVAAIAALAGCEPKDMPRRSVSGQVAQDHPNAGTLWPILLQHCQRAMACDPMSKFGEGAGEASGLAGSTTYFVQSAEAVSEGGQDYGGAITLSFDAERGAGGAGGRPVTQDELPSNLRSIKARRSTLWVEYRAPAGKFEPYFLSFLSGQIVMGVPGDEAAKNQKDIEEITANWVQAQTWPKTGEAGARIDIIGKAGVLFEGYSTGMASGQQVETKEAVKRGFEPWKFYLSRNIRDEPAEGLMKAIAAGETLSLKLTLPDGRLLLKDAFYTDGYSAALKEAEAALADPEIAAPLTARCVPFIGKADETWTDTSLSAALRTCDPRTPGQRAEDAALKAGARP